MQKENFDPPVQGEKTITQHGLQRRNLLKLFGGSMAVVTVAAACKKNDATVDDGINLGSGDVGILNYAYALEQLEAAFYTQTRATPYGGITTLENSYLNDIKNHEVIHREFFKAALGASAITTLEFDFSTIDFSSRTSVLATAMAFEDLGVSAYNGAGKLITDPNYLTLAGKIVSVEARHAALIRDLIMNGSFANSVDSNGLDTAKTPSEVLAIAGTYIKTKLNASNLPTS